MNICEAAKSGKKFRRKSWGPESWLCKFDGNGFYGFQNYDRYEPMDDDLTADDWEIERTPREWTLYQDSHGIAAWMDSETPQLKPGERVKVKEIME